MLSNIQRMNFCYLKIIPNVHPSYDTGIIRHSVRNKRKNSCVCIHQVMWLIIMKMKMEVNISSHVYDINRPRSWHGHKYSKWKKCLSIMMLVCIKEHLSNIWSSVHEKVKQHWGWVEKRRCLQKKKARNSIKGTLTQIWKSHYMLGFT